VFLNNNDVDTAITCDMACFTAMGFKAGQKLQVRDLWAAKDLTPIDLGNNTMFTPDYAGNGDGGGSMVTFSP
jgi:hypothetical protein